MRTKKPESADRMLEAAARLFSARLYHEVRMEDVAQEAGVGKGTLYRYFADKDELYLALLKRAGRRMLDRIADQLARGGSSRCQLDALVDAILTFLDDEPHILDLIQRADSQPGPRNPWKPTREKAFQIVAEVLTDGIERGEFIIADVPTAALMLLGSLRAVHRFGDRPRPADLPQRIVTMFLHGVSTKPPAIRSLQLQA